MKANNRLNIKISTEDKEKVRIMAGFYGLSVGEYSRRKILGKRLVVKHVA